MQEDIIVEGKCDFNRLEFGVNGTQLKIDRYVMVDGLGLFFYLGGQDEEHLVCFIPGSFTIQRIDNPGDAWHYYVKQKDLDTEKYQIQTFYLTYEEERPFHFKTGQQCLYRLYVNRVVFNIRIENAVGKENILKKIEDEPDEKTKEKIINVLKELEKSTEIIRTLPGGHVLISVLGKEEWVNQKDIITYEEALML